jgi:hypothetical protein
LVSKLELKGNWQNAGKDYHAQAYIQAQNWFFPFPF